MDYQEELNQVNKKLDSIDERLSKIATNLEVLTTLISNYLSLYMLTVKCEKVSPSKFEEIKEAFRKRYTGTKGGE